MLNINKVYLKKKTHTHARTHAHARARTHTHTHTHKGSLTVSQPYMFPSSQKATISFMSVHPPTCLPGTTWLPLNRLS